MSTYFIKQGSSFRVTDAANLDIRNELPVGTYTLLVDPKGFYLEHVADMELPAKLYGNTERMAARILATFNDRTVNTGILLEGEKGSGKTLLARKVSILGAEIGLPTIIVNSEYGGEGFNTFMASITQPCIFLFDEFEKTFDEQHQNALLTVLDGVFTSKKLFVFTANNSWKIASAMKNRPGRLFYSMKFRGIEAEAVQEYCQDVLVDKTQIEGVMHVAQSVDAFNFDMLKALIEEMNRYNESAMEAVQLLNIRPEAAGYVKYKVHSVTMDGRALKIRGGARGMNPLASEVEIYTMEDVPRGRGRAGTEELQKKFPNLFDEDGCVKEYSVELHPNHYKGNNPDGMAMFVKDNYVVLFSRDVEKEFAYSAAY